jgi:hypothetical protein
VDFFEEASLRMKKQGRRMRILEKENQILHRAVKTLVMICTDMQDTLDQLQRQKLETTKALITDGCLQDDGAE